MWCGCFSRKKRAIEEVYKPSVIPIDSHANHASPIMGAATAVPPPPQRPPLALADDFDEADNAADYIDFAHSRTGSRRRCTPTRSALPDLTYRRFEECAGSLSSSTTSSEGPVDMVLPLERRNTGVLGGDGAEGGGKRLLDEVRVFELLEQLLRHPQSSLSSPQSRRAAVPKPRPRSHHADPRLVPQRTKTVLFDSDLVRLARPVLRRAHSHPPCGSGYARLALHLPDMKAGSQARVRAEPAPRRARSQPPTPGPRAPPVRHSERLFLGRKYLVTRTPDGQEWVRVGGGYEPVEQFESRRARLLLGRGSSPRARMGGPENDEQTYSVMRKPSTPTRYCYAAYSPPTASTVSNWTPRRITGKPEPNPLKDRFGLLGNGKVVDLK